MTGSRLFVRGKKGKKPEPRGNGKALFRGWNSLEEPLAEVQWERPEREKKRASRPAKSDSKGGSRGNERSKTVVGTGTGKTQECSKGGRRKINKNHYLRNAENGGTG